MTDHKKQLSGSEKRSAVQIISIDDDIAGQRLDNFLLSRLKGAPKSLIYRIVRKGEVRVNKGRIKPEYKLQAGDLVRIPPVRLSAAKAIPPASKQLSRLLEASILYEDKDLVIINKPSGIAVHGGSGVSLGLIEAMRQLKSQEKHLELVHRLDRDTSGCIMIAKSRRCLRHLQSLLREGKDIQKTYLALVTGNWPKRRVAVNMPLIKNQLASGERYVKVAAVGVDGAKSSLTQYRIVDSFSTTTLIEAKPITGRTHQIRVHCQHAGHPILGDDKYGDHDANQQLKRAGLKRLFLHAYQLDLTLQNGQNLHVEAPLDDELTAVIKRLSEVER